MVPNDRQRKLFGEVMNNICFNNLKHSYNNNNKSSFFKYIYLKEKTYDICDCGTKCIYINKQNPIFGAKPKIKNIQFKSDNDLLYELRKLDDFKEYDFKTLYYIIFLLRQPKYLTNNYPYFECNFCLKCIKGYKSISNTNYKFFNLINFTSKIKIDI
jgi:hypothetical protein